MSEHQTKPFSIVLVNHEFSKIRIGCSATASDGNRLECAIRQEDVDRFCIKIRHNKVDSMDIKAISVKRKSVDDISAATAKGMNFKI